MVSIEESKKMPNIQERNSIIPENAHRHEISKVLDTNVLETIEEPIKVMKIIHIGSGKKELVADEESREGKIGKHVPD